MKTICAQETASLSGIGGENPSGFIENKGQIIDLKNRPNPAVLYLLNTPGFNVQLRKTGFCYDLYRISNIDQRIMNIEPSSSSVQYPASSIMYHRIDIDLVGINRDYQIETSEPSADYLNYFTSGTPAQGIREVRYYQSVTYRNIYQGIDLEFMMTQENGWKYNFVVHPGGNLTDIRLKISGPDQIQVAGDTLKFTTSLGIVDELIPESYLLNDGSCSVIKSRFVEIEKGIYGFSPDTDIPETATLVIDPTSIRSWGTYYGGISGTIGMTVSVDNELNVILAGSTNCNTNIASTGAYDTTWNMYNDLFIAKFTAAGVRLWGTYYGGAGTEYLQGSKTDMTGNIYVTGWTCSNSYIASPGSFQDTCSSYNNIGPSAPFLAKFSPNGWRIWGTYYGGWKTDLGYDVDVDQDGYVYIAGETNGTPTLGTPGTYQPEYYMTTVMTQDGFLAKFDSAGARIWGTFYGIGCLFTGISVDSSGIIYAAGSTRSPDTIASSGAYQTVYGGEGDAFLVAFTPTGQRLWGTYYGGSLQDGDWFGGSYPYVRCKADQNGSVYLTGFTQSLSGIASAGGYQQTFGGGSQDGFVAKFNSAGQRTWGTYYGGTGNEYVYSCSPGWNGDVFFTGETNSADGITTAGSYMPAINGGTDAFLVKFNSAGQRQWGTYFGGSGYDKGCSSGYVVDDTIYFSGNTNSPANIASSGAHQVIYNGGMNAFLEKFIECWPIAPAQSITGAVKVCQGTYGLAYSTDSLGHAVSYEWTLPPGATIVAGIKTTDIIVDFSPTATSGYITVRGLNKCGDPGDSAAIYVNVYPHPVPIITGPDTTCTGNGKIYSTATGKTDYQWSTSPGGTVTAGAGTATATITWTVPGVQHVYLSYTENGCVTLTPSVYDVWVDSGPPVSISIAAYANNVCAGTPVTFTATPLNGGPNPFFQWKVNGVVAGGNSSVFTYSPSDGDQVTCVVTSDAVCSSNNPATSNAITMTVIPNLPVNISVSASANPVCAGTSVTFTATAVNGGTNPTYQWKVNGINTGTNNPVYSYIPSNGDSVRCILTSSEICTSGNPASSNKCLMTVNPILPVGVTISASANPVCAGTLVSFTATPVNGGSNPSYQWKVNGINVGTSNPVYSYIPANGDSIRCILTSFESCISGNPASSSKIHMIINNNLPVSVAITASPNPFCPGVTVNYTATPSNGGTSPSYQWKRNGINSGTNSPNFSCSPQPGDSIWCILTSNITCASGNPASSNKIFMVSKPVPVVTFTLCFDSITRINAKPVKLKGGIPLGGTYTGPGVNPMTGIFSPAIAGTGTKTISYSYTNSSLCSASKTKTIIVLSAAAFICGNNLTDIRDNKVYKTIQIGSQCWMAENLNYGSLVPGAGHQRDNCIPEKYCSNDQTSDCGLRTFYQWDELMQYQETPGLQGLCPPAWHIPTDAEWNTLFSNWTNNAFAGVALKYSGWSGFNALLSGVRHMTVEWNWKDFATFFWSSTPYTSTKAWSHGMNDFDPGVSTYPALRSNAFSVRCLKD